MKDVSEARREDKKETAELMGKVQQEMKEDIEESLHHEREHFDRKFEAVQVSSPNQFTSYLNCVVGIHHTYPGRVETRPLYPHQKRRTSHCLE